MKTLTIKLKQHTPLIHFQHDQEGATLRASEVKPKLDKFILSKLTPEEKSEGKHEGWIKSKNDKVWLDYKMRIEDNPDNIIKLYTNKKRLYSKKDEDKDKRNNKRIVRVNYGDIIQGNVDNARYVIRQDGKEYFGKLRKEDSKIIYDLIAYPCFFANLDADINDSNEYRKVTYAENPFNLLITTKHSELYNLFSDKNNRNLLPSFFLHNNFGTRQSKGFGSFYIDEEDELYRVPFSKYHFSLDISEKYYEDEFLNLFKKIELFTKTLRAGINEKRGKQTVFYFKSLAFMYCKEVLKAEWDKKRVKTKFYYNDLINQRKEYPNDDYHDILFFDENDGYDIRDLMGFSTNEEWQSYKDSIEKKVAIVENNRTRFPRKDEDLPVERMRSPILIKPVCNIDEDDNVSYKIYLIFQDEEVGMNGLKQQQEICFFSKKKKDRENKQRKIMLKIPQKFSMSDYFDYIFNKNRLNFKIATHVEEQFQEYKYYDILEDIYNKIKINITE